MRFFRIKCNVLILPKSKIVVSPQMFNSNYYNYYRRRLQPDPHSYTDPATTGLSNRRPVPIFNQPRPIPVLLALFPCSRWLVELTLHQMSHPMSQRPRQATRKPKNKRKFDANYGKNL